MPHGTSSFFANRLRDLAWGAGFTAILAPPVAYSLALDDITVRSSLGQPFNAVISVGGAPGEALQTSCFSVSDVGANGFPAIEGVRLHFDPATGQLALRSNYAVMEPLNELVLRVHCEGSPALERSFLIALDPPDMMAESVFASRSAPDEQASRAAAVEAFVPAARADLATPRSETASGVEPAGLPAPRRAPRPALIAPSAAINPGSEYMVETGDTLSTIASRVYGRPSGSVWAIADRIHATNPMAFLGDDPDRLIAGVAIAIPALDASLALPVARSARPRAAAATFVDGLLAENVMALPQRRYALSTAFSLDSIEKLALRRQGYMRAAEAAARMQAKLDAVGQEPEEPLGVRPDEPVALPMNDDGVDTYDLGQESEDAVQSQVAPAAADTPPAVASATIDETPVVALEPVAESSSWGWKLWAFVLLAGGVIVGLITRTILRQRQSDIIQQNQRRASGRQVTIRPLDHGIIVDEHHSGTPLMVDAPTASTRILKEVPTPPATVARDAAQKVVPAPLVDTDFAVIDLPDAPPSDLTLQIESPIATLDLELPEMLDLPGSPSEAHMPTEMVEAAEHDALGDSRQFHVDTDLLALAYVEDMEHPVPEHEIELLPMDDADIYPSNHAAAPEQPSSNEDAYYHLEADPLDDTLLDGEGDDESKVLALWDLDVELEVEPPSAPPSRSRASKRR